LIKLRALTVQAFVDQRQTSKRRGDGALLTGQAGRGVGVARMRADASSRATAFGRESGAQHADC